MTAASTIDQPKRIQRKRTRGWKMPPNTVSVTRPGRWGNPYRVLSEEGWPLIEGPGRFTEGVPDCDWNAACRRVVTLFRERCLDALPDLAPLRGKNLACWCPLDQPCHADVLLEIANAPTIDRPKE